MVKSRVMNTCMKLGKSYRGKPTTESSVKVYLPSGRRSEDQSGDDNKHGVGNVKPKYVDHKQQYLTDIIDSRSFAPCARLRISQGAT